MSKVKLVIFVIIIVVATFVISWFSFNAFYNKEPRLINNLEIYLQNNTELDEDSDLNVASFRLVNKGNYSVNYKVVIKDLVKGNKSIDRKYITYKLKLGDKVVKSGRLSELDDDTLMSGSIDGNSKYDYTLELVIDDMVDLEGKTYSYDLEIWPIM